MRLCFEEPFRLFFPAATLAGLFGVMLWPLHSAGVLSFYPGTSHARLMAHGFFGGFILGFLMTALPRLTEARRFTVVEVLGYLGGLIAMGWAHATGRVALGDRVWLVMLCGLFASCAGRIVRGSDLPPPGFVLVLLALACGVGGGVITLAEEREELAGFWLRLKPLVYYQGFVLLPILGVGPFLLPRFFGLSSPHNHPAATSASPLWRSQMWRCLGIGAGVMGSFVLEAAGWPLAGHGLRAVVCVVWFVGESGLGRARAGGSDLARGLLAALGFTLLGFLVLTLTALHRVAWLHVTLVGGLGLLTLAVATRVVFGHSGQGARLAGPNGWFLACGGLMVLAMATRISGDFWPAIAASHYNYAAGLWGAALVWWAVMVLPKVRLREAS